MSNYEDASVFNIGQIETLPVQVEFELNWKFSKSCLPLELIWSSAKCSGMQDVVGQRKWTDELQPFWRKRDEIVVEGDCVLWGTRVIVPNKLRDQVLKELHRAHSGIVQMKVFTHSHVWWPGLDEQVEKCAKACIACQVNQNSPPKAPLHPWAWPTTPWQRLHVDYAGPINSMMLLIIVDVHSKWPEVYMVNSMTARTTIARLRETFACFGLPEQLASDNGPWFTSEEFETLLRQNGVKHLCSSPYHPTSNGAAERFVQVVKWAVRIGLWEGHSMDHALTNFLLQYCHSSCYHLNLSKLLTIWKNSMDSFRLVEAQCWQMYMYQRSSKETKETAWSAL